MSDRKDIQVPKDNKAISPKSEVLISVVKPQGNLKQLASSIPLLIKKINEHTLDKEICSELQEIVEEASIYNSHIAQYIERVPGIENFHLTLAPTNRKSSPSFEVTFKQE